MLAVSSRQSPAPFLPSLLLSQFHSRPPLSLPKRHLAQSPLFLFLSLLPPGQRPSAAALPEQKPPQSQTEETPPKSPSPVHQ